MTSQYDVMILRRHTTIIWHHAASVNVTRDNLQCHRCVTNNCKEIFEHNASVILSTVQVSNAGDTLFKKLVPVTCASRLAPETCTCVSQSGSLQVFFWYKFLAHNWAQLYSSTETFQHVTRTVQRDWLESCFAARTCDELASNFSCRFLVQVSWAHVVGTSQNWTETSLYVSV